METNHKVLIVEDDKDFRRIVKEMVTSEGFEADEAENGEDARELIKNGGYSVVVSDIQMPQFNGVELVEWVRKVYDRSFKDNQELPIVMMTGFAHIVETQKVHDLGVQKFLTKPFEEKELILSIKEILGIEDKTEEESEDAALEVIPDYCRISLGDFVTDKDIQMDVYVKLSEKKYIKIAHKGGKIDLSRIESYKKKGMHYLYIERQEFRKVIDFNIMLTKVVAKNDKLSVEKKKRFMTHTAEVLLENTFVNGVDQQSYVDARNFLTTGIDVLTDDEETFSLLEVLSSHSDHVFAHSLAVSVYSVMIAKKMGWTSSANLFKLSFGALMHDVGKKEFPRDLLEKPRTMLSYEERMQLESHAFRGKEILESLKSASAEVVEIAYQHHENELGHGYPRKLEKNRIHPMAKIVATANEFCNYAVKGPHNPGVPLRKAIHLIETYKQDQLDKETVEALKLLKG